MHVGWPVVLMGIRAVVATSQLLLCRSVLLAVSRSGLLKQRLEPGSKYNVTVSNEVVLQLVFRSPACNNSCSCKFLIDTGTCSCAFVDNDGGKNVPRTLRRKGHPEQCSEQTLYISTGAFLLHYWQGSCTAAGCLLQQAGMA